MTVFESIVKGGPEALADVITDLTIKTVKQTYSRNFGMDIEVPDDVRATARDDFYNALIKEM